MPQAHQSLCIANEPAVTPKMPRKPPSLVSCKTFPWTNACPCNLDLHSESLSPTPDKHAAPACHTDGASPPAPVVVATRCCPRSAIELQIVPSYPPKVSNPVPHSQTSDLDLPLSPLLVKHAMSAFLASDSITPRQLNLTRTLAANILYHRSRTTSHIDAMNDCSAAIIWLVGFARRLGG